MCNMQGARKRHECVSRFMGYGGGRPPGSHDFQPVTEQIEDALRGINWHEGGLSEMFGFRVYPGQLLQLRWMGRLDGAYNLPQSRERGAGNCWHAKHRVEAKSRAAPNSNHSTVSLGDEV